MCLHRQSSKLVFLESVFEWHILLENERERTSRMSSYDSYYFQVRSYLGFNPLFTILGTGTCTRRPLLSRSIFRARAPSLLIHFFDMFQYYI